MAKRKKTVHCPYCSKDVAVNAKGLLVPHIVARRISCIGSGFRADQAANMAENAERLAAEYRKRGANG